MRQNGNLTITGLELNNVLKQVWLLMETELQTAILRTPAEPERDDSETFRNVANCRALLHDRVAEVHFSLPDMVDFEVGFGVDIAVSERA